MKHNFFQSVWSSPLYQVTRTQKVESTYWNLSKICKIIFRFRYKQDLNTFNTMPLYQVEAYYAQNAQFVNYRNAKLQNTKRNTKYKSEFSLHQLLISLAKFSAHFNLQPLLLPNIFSVKQCLCSIYSIKRKQVELIIHVLFHFLYKFHLPSKSTRMISQFK